MQIVKYYPKGQTRRKAGTQPRTRTSSVQGCRAPSLALVHGKATGLKQSAKIAEPAPKIWGESTTKA